MVSSLLKVAAAARLRRRDLETLASSLARTLAVPALTIRLLDPTGQWLDLKASAGLPKTLRARIRRIPLHSPAGQAIATRRRRVAVAGDRGGPSVWPSSVAKRYKAGGFAPIRSGSTMLGVIGVAYHEAARPPRAQMRSLEILGEQLGAALQLARARATRGKARTESHTLRKIMTALSRNLEPRAVIDMVTEAAVRLTRASGAIVMLHVPETDEFEIASQSAGRPGVQIRGMRFPTKESLAVRVIRTGRSFRCRDATTDPRPMLRALVDIGHVRGLLIVPLRTSEGAIGTLNVSSYAARLFSDRDRRVLMRLGQHASVAIQNARLFDAVRSHRHLLRQLYSQQFATLEGERKRIAHELHDELGPTLSATLINLQIVQRLGAAEAGLTSKVAETERLLTGMVEKVRELSYGLRPPMLEHLGLAESLRWMIETHFGAGKPAVQYGNSGDDGALDPELALAIYRIAQEALTNVVRHAGAGHAEVHLHITSSALTLRVADDGCGFDPYRQVRERRSGLGLAGMRERVEQLGGRIEIRSAASRGCQLTVSCPIEVERARTVG